MRLTKTKIKDFFPSSFSFLDFSLIAKVADGFCSYMFLGKFFHFYKFETIIKFTTEIIY